ncbi:MAG: hypothetical protein L0H96_16970, partial [Humibacillus sp.]|nr:hypothetical protein [Humibacillus sp.]
MRPTLVPGRWPGAVIATAGGLLALPTFVWPVLVITYSPSGDPTDAGKGLSQGVWSWGRYAQLGDPHGGPVFDVSNTTGLVFLLVTCVVGLGGALAWALVDGAPGAALGLAGTCVAAAGQLSSPSQWAGEKLSGFYGDESGDGVSIELAGWLQIASVVVLVVAIGFMLWRPVSMLLRPVWQNVGAGRPAEASDEAADGPPPMPQGTAVLRERDENRRRPHDDRPSVGFSDDDLDHDPNHDPNQYPPPGPPQRPQQGPPQTAPSR